MNSVRVAGADEARRLMDEASFADEAYSRFANQLALNQGFYQKYATPVDEWDWRQWGAKRLGKLAGCSVLDFGCGAGEETTYLAKLGATVTAIDISPVGVQLTNARARFNGVGDRVRALEMRCDPTDFPDASFDIVHGFGILHHVGLRAGLLEVRRLLKPGGRGLFFEHMGNSKLIERIRPKEGHATDHEKPVAWRDVMNMRSNFSTFEAYPFHLISRLRGSVAFCGRPLIKRVDHGLLKLCPPLRFFASGVVIYLEK